MFLRRLLNSLCILILCASSAYAKSTVADLPPELVDFSGQLDNHTPPLFLNGNDFTELTNFRYYAGGIGTRSGMTDWTTEADGEEIVSVFPFEHDNDGLHILAATVNPANGVSIYQVEDKTFSLLYTDSSTTVYPVTYGAVRDSIVIGDETGVSIWSGTSVTPLTLLVETAGTITDRTEWIHTGASEHVPSGSIWYVGYSRPFDAVQADENSGTWDTSFSSSVTPELKAEFFRYWATCTCTSGGSFFQSPKINTTFRPLTSTWDGSWQYAGAAVFQQSGASEYQDYSLLVADSSEESYMDVGGWESGGTVALGFFDRPRSVKIRLPEDYKNTAASVLTFKYWNGSSIVSVSGTAVDGTSHGGAAVAQSGLLTIPKLTDWEPMTYGESEWSLYYLFLKTSATIDDYVRIYSILAIPEIDDPNDQNYKGVAEYKGRIFLYNGNDKNLVLMSAYNQPDVYVGDDAFSPADNFRIGKKEKVIATATVRDGMFWLKESENFFMTGYNPVTISQGVVKLPGTMPCIAPESVQVVEIDGGQFVIYQARDGWYGLDSAGNNPKLSNPVSAYFKDGNTLEIETAWLSRTRSVYDQKEGEYHAFIAAGSGATQFTERAVFNVKQGKWSIFDVDANVELSCGNVIHGDDGQYLRLAGGYDGKIYEFEKTGDDAGYDIVSIFERPPYTLRGGVGQQDIRGRNAVGEQELRAIAFNFRLPDDTAITGCSMYLTSGSASTETTHQEYFNLTDDGWRSSAMEPDWTKKGDYHIIKMRVPGRIEFYRQIMWSREAPWEISMSLDFLIDEHGNLLTGNDYLLRS